MEKNNIIGQDCIKIIEESLKELKKAVNQSTEEQITLQDINSKLEQIQDQLNKITNAVI